MNQYSRDTVRFLPATRTRQRGFSLIEIALVLVIVGLALGGIMAALGPQLENKKISDTQARIKEASDAIIAFAMVNGRLPCPASRPSITPVATRGQSAPTSPANGLCTSFDGYVPARTLGLAEQGVSGDSEGVVQDAWGFGLRYRVSDHLSAGNYPLTQADGIKNADAATRAALNKLIICDSSNAITPPTCGGAANLANAALTVWSTGPNAAGVGGADEAKNLDADVIYVHHERRAATGLNGEYDDILSWQTVNTLVSNMTKAGVLP